MVVSILLRNHTHLALDLAPSLFAEEGDGAVLWKPPLATRVRPMSHGPLGRLSTPFYLDSGAETFVSIRLTSAAAGASAGAALVLRVRVRAEKTHDTLSLCLAATPAAALVPLSIWFTSRQKHVFSWYCGGQVYRATLSKTTLSNVSLELVAATDGAAEAARAVFQRLAQRPDRLYREVYENERKIHVLGQTKYSKGALTVLDRPAWSSSDGRRLGSPDVVMLPSPRWRWCGAWTLETAEQYTDADGWRYASGWWEGGEWRAGAAFGRLVRRRRWIRFQEKVPAEEPPARAAAVPRAAPPLNASALLAHLARTLPAWCDAAPFLEHEPRLPFLTLKQALFEVRAAAIALTVDHAAQDAAGVCRDLQGAPRRVAPPPAQGPFLCR